MTEDLTVFYRDFGSLVSRDSGGAFRGLLDTADQSAFDMVVVGTHQLRYDTAVGLGMDEMLTIGGARYRVAAPPRRIDDGAESIAQLVAA